jgi:hypothetical protein
MKKKGNQKSVSAASFAGALEQLNIIFSLLE